GSMGRAERVRPARGVVAGAGVEPATVEPPQVPPAGRLKQAEPSRRAPESAGRVAPSWAPADPVAELIGREPRAAPAEVVAEPLALERPVPSSTFADPVAEAEVVGAVLPVAVAGRQEPSRRPVNQAGH